MIEEYRQLVQEITQVTGAAPPMLLEDDAPVLGQSALGESAREMYLVGLIGGKDVGKSALANALVGREITQQTSHGPGTEIVVAYAHESQVEALERLLEREVPGQFRIVEHRVEELRRQVLLDLPDIDSHWASHVEVTRRMLKHMLFPMWIQSIEKYADRRPRELLELVSEGNAPQNFVFCLNKADQIMDREGEEAARELEADYARRLKEILGLAEAPRVWLISAIHPERYDLPALRAMVAQQRSEESVERSRKWAMRRQGLSLAEWIDRQGLDQRLAAVERLGKTAAEELGARVIAPLVEEAIPRLLEDPAYRMALADELMQQRVRRWPIVNVLHVVLGPVMAMLRRRLPLAQQRGMEGPEELVAMHLGTVGAALAKPGMSIAALVQSTFAFLQQSSPLASRLYGERKLWEEAPADAAEAELRQRLAATVERQRGAIRSKVGIASALGGVVRVVLTIGALLWFPFIQPILQEYLKGGAGGLARLAIALFGVEYLLKNVTFLAIYFVILWLVLKWGTQRRVDKWLSRWKAGGGLDPALNLSAQVIEWGHLLLEPIRTARGKLAELKDRAEELRRTVMSGEAA